MNIQALIFDEIWMLAMNVWICRSWMKKGMGKRKNIKTFVLFVINPILIAVLHLTNLSFAADGACMGLMIAILNQRFEAREGRKMQKEN